MQSTILAYNASLSSSDEKICNILFSEICKHLTQAEFKIWHAHPVWFINENPIVGYSKLKSGVRLMFWSGQSFDENNLKADGKFKASSIGYIDEKEINKSDLERWLQKAIEIQWDYKNIVKRKGVLEPLF